MDDFNFMKTMNEEDAYLFKRCIRKMLDATFIVADKDEKLYEFISSSSACCSMATFIRSSTTTLYPIAARYILTSN